MENRLCHRSLYATSKFISINKTHYPHRQTAIAASKGILKISSNLTLSTNIDHVFVTGSWSPELWHSELMDLSTWAWNVTTPYLNKKKTISHHATLYYNGYFYVIGGHISNYIGTWLISTSLSNLIMYTETAAIQLLATLPNF